VDNGGGFGMGFHCAEGGGPVGGAYLGPMYVGGGGFSVPPGECVGGDMGGA